MLSITLEALQKIRLHAIEEAPREACGILAGRHKREISKVLKCENVDGNPYIAYTIAPSQLLAIIDEIESEGSEVELVGFYHTHPFSSAHPSLVDVERAAWEGFVYAIYSIPDHELACWRWFEGEGFAREGLKVKQKAGGKGYVGEEGENRV